LGSLRGPSRCTRVEAVAGSRWGGHQGCGNGDMFVGRHIPEPMCGKQCHNSFTQTV
jgi:hypothetical protein